MKGIDCSSNAHTKYIQFSSSVWMMTAPPMPGETGNQWETAGCSFGLPAGVDGFFTDYLYYW
ncbi:MAG TPA: hypothetical protein PLE48_04935 [Thiobacillus sp.]|nr:hypothetical protein [Thiobacillus sp.]HQT69748.1 hypothetical protein [Thiobacillus sp.]